MINIHASRGKPCYFLRFNPDPFKIGGVTSRIPIADRYVELRRQLTLALSKPPSSDIVVTYEVKRVAAIQGINITDDSSTTPPDQPRTPLSSM